MKIKFVDAETVEELYTHESESKPYKGMILAVGLRGINGTWKVETVDESSDTLIANCKRTSKKFKPTPSGLSVLC